MSKYAFIAAPFIAWFLAQLIKAFIALAKGQKRGKAWDAFSGSGGMPSGHSAIMSAIFTAILMTEGLYSPLTGLAAAMAAIVMYDAMHVRRSVGEIGAIVKSQTGVDASKLYVANGHKPQEVLAGAVLGVVVALVMLKFL